MSRPKQRKDLGNGVRPCAALGVKYPIWRLGALVSLPYSIGKVMMVQIPDRSLSLKPTASRTAGKTFPPALLLNWPQRSANQGKAAELTIKGSNTTRKINNNQHKAISARRGYGSRPGRQGIARHVPPCPAALHLDCLDLRHGALLGFCFWDSVFSEAWL